MLQLAAKGTATAFLEAFLSPADAPCRDCCAQTGRNFRRAVALDASSPAVRGCLLVSKVPSCPDLVSFVRVRGHRPPLSR